MYCARPVLENQVCDSGQRGSLVGLWLIVIESVTSYQKWKSQHSFDVTLARGHWRQRKCCFAQWWWGRRRAWWPRQACRARPPPRWRRPSSGRRLRWAETRSHSKKEKQEKKKYKTFCVPQFPHSCFLFSRLPSHKIFTKIDHDASLISSIYTPTIFLTSWWCRTQSTY